MLRMVSTSKKGLNFVARLPEMVGGSASHGWCQQKEAYPARYFGALSRFLSVTIRGASLHGSPRACPILRSSPYGGIAHPALLLLCLALLVLAASGRAYAQANQRPTLVEVMDPEPDKGVTEMGFRGTVAVDGDPEAAGSFLAADLDGVDPKIQGRAGASGSNWRTAGEYSTDPVQGPAERLAGAVIISSDYGSLSLEESGDWSYVLDNSAQVVDAIAVGATATDTFTFRAVDGAISTVFSDVQTIEITVHGLDDPPRTRSSSHTVRENGSALVVATNKGVVAAATDPDGADSLLRVQQVQSIGTMGAIVSSADAQGRYVVQGLYGTIHFGTSGGYTYAPGPEADSLPQDAAPQDVFEYWVGEPGGPLGSGRVSISVFGVNDAPVAASGDLFHFVVEPGTEFVYRIPSKTETGAPFTDVDIETTMSNALEYQLINSPFSWLTVGPTSGEFRISPPIGTSPTSVSGIQIQALDVRGAPAIGVFRLTVSATPLPQFRVADITAPPSAEAFALKIERMTTGGMGEAPATVKVNVTDPQGHVSSGQHELQFAQGDDSQTLALSRLSPKVPKPASLVEVAIAQDPTYTIDEGKGRASFTVRDTLPTFELLEPSFLNGGIRMIVARVGSNSGAATVTVRIDNSSGLLGADSIVREDFVFSAGEDPSRVVRDLPLVGTPSASADTSVTMRVDEGRSHIIAGALERELIIKATMANPLVVLLEIPEYVERGFGGDITLERPDSVGQSLQTYVEVTSAEFPEPVIVGIRFPPNAFTATGSFVLPPGVPAGDSAVATVQLLTPNEATAKAQGLTPGAYRVGVGSFRTRPLALTEANQPPMLIEVTNPAPDKIARESGFRNGIMLQSDSDDDSVAGGARNAHGRLTVSDPDNPTTPKIQGRALGSNTWTTVEAGDPFLDPFGVTILRGTYGVLFMSFTDLGRWHYTLADFGNFPRGTATDGIPLDAIENDVFVLRADDGETNLRYSREVMITINVLGLNDPVRTVQDRAKTVAEDDPALTVPAAQGVLANDVDPDGDDASIRMIYVRPQGDSKRLPLGQDVQGAYGTLNMKADGGYTYTPGGVLPSGHTREDFFVYGLADEHGDESSGILRIPVSGVNNPPMVVGEGIPDLTVMFCPPASTTCDDILSYDIPQNGQPNAPFTDVDDESLVSRSNNLSIELVAPIPPGLTRLLPSTDASAGRFRYVPPNRTPTASRVQVRARDINGAASVEDSFLLTTVQYSATSIMVGLRPQGSFDPSASPTAVRFPFEITRTEAQVTFPGVVHIAINDPLGYFKPLPAPPGVNTRENSILILSSESTKGFALERVNPDAVNPAPATVSVSIVQDEGAPGYFIDFSNHRQEFEVRDAKPAFSLSASPAADSSEINLTLTRTGNNQKAASVVIDIADPSLLTGLSRRTINFQEDAGSASVDIPLVVTPEVAEGKSVTLTLAQDPSYVVTGMAEHTIAFMDASGPRVNLTEAPLRVEEGETASVRLERPDTVGPRLQAYVRVESSALPESIIASVVFAPNAFTATGTFTLPSDFLKTSQAAGTITLLEPSEATAADSTLMPGMYRVGTGAARMRDVVLGMATLPPTLTEATTPEPDKMVTEVGYRNGIRVSGDPFANGRLIVVDPDTPNPRFEGRVGSSGSSWRFADSAANSGKGRRFDSDYGSLFFKEDGVWTYELDNEAVATNAIAFGRSATDTFTFRANDGLPLRPNLSDVLTLQITVNGLNDPPETVADVLRGRVVENFPGITVPAGEGVLANDSDPDTGDTIEVSSVQSISLQGPVVAVGMPAQGRYGTLVMQANGSYTYTPGPGADSIALSAAPFDVFAYLVN